MELNARMQKGFKVKAGTTILLEAEVFGKPMPRVTWKRGDDSLKSGEGQVITQQRHHFQLEMMAVTKEHTGTYTILAENASGSKTAEIQVNVLGEYFFLFFMDVRHSAKIQVGGFSQSMTCITLNSALCATASPINMLYSIA